METPNKKFSFYSANDLTRDLKRVGDEDESDELPKETYRSHFRKDYARLIHSASFRRLCGKTQLYPGSESDFFRNRFSHSLEVAQIAKSIAIKLNNTEKFPDNTNLDLDTDLVEFAALAHDIGHPPFGHQGEKALDQCMLDEGGFEGNAQTLRIISRIEKKFLPEQDDTTSNIIDETGIKKGNDERTGLNLTARSLASILKYSDPIPDKLDERFEKEKDAIVINSKEENEKKAEKEEKKYLIKPVKGYYKVDRELIEHIQSWVLGEEIPEGIKFKTVECWIMDIADDIAYSTYDLEDGLKGGFYHPMDIIFSKKELLEKVRIKVNKHTEKKYLINDIINVFIEIFDRWLFPHKFDGKREFTFDEQLEFMRETYDTSKSISGNGYARTGLTSFLVGMFIRGASFEINTKFPQLSRVYLDDKTKLFVETLKHFNFESMIASPRLRIAEFRGQEIITKIFDTLSNRNRKGYQLLPKDFQEIYGHINEAEKSRIICDFIAGMTDRYCLEFYGRLISENPETIFKPF